MKPQYAEAKCFQLFLKEGRVIAPSELENVERDECVPLFSLVLSAHCIPCWLYSGICLSENPMLCSCRAYRR